jgi:hypothetical protein
MGITTTCLRHAIILRVLIDGFEAMFFFLNIRADMKPATLMTDSLSMAAVWPRDMEQ